MLNSGDQPAPRRLAQASSRKGCMRGKGGPENASCRFKGVRQRTWGKWVARIREPNRGARLWLGTFDNSESAALAYDKAVRRLYGPGAKVNFPDRVQPMNPPAAVNPDQVSNTTIMPNEEIQIPNTLEIQLPDETEFIQMPDMGTEMQLQLVTPPGDKYLSLSYDYSYACPFCGVIDQFILQDKNQHYDPLPNVDHELFLGNNNIEKVGEINDDYYILSKDTIFKHNLKVNSLPEFGGSSLCNNIDKVVQKDNNDSYLSTAEGITNYKENLKLDLPEFDDSSLWTEAIATTDFQKMIDLGFLAADFEDGKHWGLSNQGINNFSFF